MPDQHQLVASGLGTSLSRIVTAYTVLRGWTDIENSTGDCCCTRAARHSAFGSVTFWRVAGRHCRRSHVSRLEAGAELLGAAGIPQWAAGIAYLLSTHQDAAIEAHFLSNKFTWGLFELLQVLVVDADDQSSSCLQQKLEELSYEGSPQPASLCRSGAMAVSCEQDFQQIRTGAAVRSRELWGALWEALEGLMH